MSSNEGPMIVACATDAAYFEHCAAMLASLIEFNPGVEVRVLCDEDVSDELRETLTAWGRERGARIHCIAPKLDLPENMPGLRSLTRAAWLRLFLPDLFPETSRILYLDVDLIVRESLQELWSAELRSHWLAAVHDVRVSYTPIPHEMRLGLRPGSTYFNSGVLVMDLVALRRENVRAAALRFAAEKPQLIRHADQDPLNVLLQEHRLPLHLRWNVQAALYENEAASDQPFSANEIQDAMKRPAIVHYCGPWKPWHHRSRHSLRHLYARYRAQTPWPEWEQEGRTFKHRVLRLMPEYVARWLSHTYWTVRNAVRPEW